MKTFYWVFLILTFILEAIPILGIVVTIMKAGNIPCWMDLKYGFILWTLWTVWWCVIFPVLII